MAWRIQDSVIRGEIDNRVKGRVRGKLWLAGLDKPVKLELEGNACPDLAGCLLKFKNLTKTFQAGRVGKALFARIPFQGSENRFKKMGLPGTFRGGLPARVRARSGD